MSDCLCLIFVESQVGSGTKNVRVHPACMIVFVLTKAEVLQTPLPFLNRFQVIVYFM